MKNHRMWKKIAAVALAAAMGIILVPYSSDIAGAEPAREVVTGAVNRVSVHDPSIIADTDANGNKTYYIFGTHIEAAKTTNLVNWQKFTNEYEAKNNKLFGDLEENLKEPFSWAGNHDADCKNGYHVWAPDVKWFPEYVNEDGSKGAYLMYFCTSSTYCRSAIAFATSDKIEGPYTCRKMLLCSGFTKNSAKDANSQVDKIWTNTNIDDLMEEGRIDPEPNAEWFAGNTAYNTDYAPNAIDPTIFTDAEGKMWMTYGSWSGGIYLLEIDPKTGDVIYPKSNGTTEDGRTIDKYFGIHIAGGHTLSGEGPYILYDAENAYYYLYTTYNYLDAVSGYNMRLFRSKNPTGPYLDAAGNHAVFASNKTNQYDIGIKVMGNYNIAGGEQGYRSPGHCSSFLDDGKMYLAYHTRFQGNEYAFDTRIHQQFMNKEGWPVTAVYENRGDEISADGYAQEEIVGTYDYINHGTASDGASVKSGDRIVLCADGTIAGDASGTWKEEDGSYYAALTIDDVEYHGVFFKQHNEKGDADAVMTFTAVGNNNMTVWGVKTSNSTSTEFVPNGTAATDISKISIKPVVSEHFDTADHIRLAGNARVEDGILKLEAKGGSIGETYAQLPAINSYDFSKGITLTADILVKKYISDWTPVFMISDGEIGSKKKGSSYHFTQGFSSIVDLSNSHIGYYGVDISQPYTWDYFSNSANRGTWYTVTVTITDKQMATYINGVKVQSISKDLTSLMSAFKNAKNVFLGGSVFDDPDFCGWMDNVAVYDKALTPEAVKAIATGSTLAGGAKEYLEDAVTNPDTNITTKKVPAQGTVWKDSKTGTSYKITKAGTKNGTVTYVSPKNRKVTSVTVPDAVTLKGITYKVTGISANAWNGCTKLKNLIIGKNVARIGSKACYHCKSLKSISIQTAKLTKNKVGTKAFAGIHAQAKVKVPKANKSAYKKIVKAKGLSGKKQTVE